MYGFCLLVLLFFSYSVFGFFCEVLSRFVHTGKFTFSRGFLLGPYLPIFGFGALAMIFFLGKYYDDVVTIFILSIALDWILEYFTSLILEKIFHLRWWDYSNDRFNLDGRICLETGIYFGIGGVFLIRLMNPFLLGVLHMWKNETIITLGFIILIIMVLDFIVSTYTIAKLKIDSSKLEDKDATSIVKAEVRKSLMRHRIFYRRTIGAFPNILKEDGMSEMKEILEEKKEKKSSKKKKS